MYDLIAENYENPETDEPAFIYGVISNKTYKFKVNEKEILVPAELIAKYNNYTLNDIYRWENS